MMLDNGLAQRGRVDVGVDFGGADAFVAEQRLNDAQVGTAFEQGGGKRVAKGVGRYGFPDACRLGLLLDHNKDHGAREVGPTTVQEHIVFLSGQKLTSPQDGAKPSKGVYIKKPPDF